MPTAGRVVIGHNGWPWSFSPDKSRVAVTGRLPLEVRIVDVGRMRLKGEIPIPRNVAPPANQPDVVALAWPTAHRIFVLVEWGAWGHALVVVDPVARRIVSRETIQGTLVGQAQTFDGFALLLAPAARIGPARLLIVGRAGKPRSISLAEIPAGLESIDPHRGISRLDRPALAVDPTGTRALVVSAGGPVAEVDLAGARVTYHTLPDPDSLLGRLWNWLEPAAEAKAEEGPERQAAWIGEHVVAVSGQDAHRFGNGDQEQTTPAGLTLIDVRHWTRRTLDKDASQFSFAAGALLAYGTSWNSATQKTTGMGLTAYGLDGKERFHLFEDEQIYWVQTARPYAYIWRNNRAPVAVDLRSGRVIRNLDRYRGNDLPALMVP
jgi:hypothetical protein